MDSMHSDFEKKKQSLLRNDDYFLRSVSAFFGFSHEHLKKYGHILDKEYLGANYDIKWNINLITAVIQQSVDNDDFFYGLSSNESLPWEFDLIEHFKDQWRWDLMALNNTVTKNGALRNCYSEQLSPYLNEYWNGTPNQLSELSGASQSLGEVPEGENFTIPYLQQQEEYLRSMKLDQPKNIDWRMLSNSMKLPWSADLIDHYKDKWDWPVLCVNQCVPWDIELMKKFEEYIDWTVDVPDENGMTSYDSLGISENRYLEWDREILETFSHKLDPWCISMSTSTKWDIDLLTQFESFWNMDGLGMNTKVWSMVFPEFEDEYIICDILDLIMDRRKLIARQG
jgi:hypothetical protein